MAGKRFIKNTSTSRIKLTTLFFYRFILNQAKAPSLNPFGRGYLCRIGRIHRSHAIGGANVFTMVVLFVDCCVVFGRYFPYYSYLRNPTGQEFGVPPRINIVVSLLNKSKLTGFVNVFTVVLLLVRWWWC